MGLEGNEKKEETEILTCREPRARIDPHLPLILV